MTFHDDLRALVHRWREVVPGPPPLPGHREEKLKCADALESLLARHPEWSEQLADLIAKLEGLRDEWKDWAERHSVSPDWDPCRDSYLEHASRVNTILTEARQKVSEWRRATRFYLWPRWFWRIGVGVPAGGRLVQTGTCRCGFSWLWWAKGETGERKP
jgi:hypothetical protein